MSKVFIAFFAALLLLAGAFALQSLGHDAAAQSPSTCQNAINDDPGDDTLINDGCPIVGLLPENHANCSDADDDDAADDPVDTVNDGCPVNGSFADCDTNDDGDCADAGEPALCQNADDDDAGDDPDDRVNDGCPVVGSLPENLACVNASDDDAADDPVDTVNDGCPQVGYYSEAPSVGGLAELPDVAGDSGSSAGTYAALAGVLAAAVLALTAGVWYARRRWVR